MDDTKLEPVSFEASSDTIDIGDDTISLPTLDLNSLASLGAYTYNTTSYGSSLTTSGAQGSSYYTWPSTVTISNGTGNAGIGTTTLSSGFHVSADAEFEGDIKWKGRSLGKMLEKIEDRLAILQEPDPEKLEKFAALKKAYDHFRLLEKLIGDEK